MSISSSVGLISGINSKDIIDQLMKLEERPKTLLQSRKDKLSLQREAYVAISGKLTTLTTSARTFQRPSTFTAATATSNDEDVLTATTSPGAAVGSYQFQVARLVTSQQSVTGGYADPTSTVKAGTISIEMGGGNLNVSTPLALLNGGAGVNRGLFRITDRSGSSSVVDISSAITLDDVIKKINTSLDIGVRASVDGDKIVLSDTTGSTDQNLSVIDLADGRAAADLGLVQSVAANTLNGTDINYLGANTPLSALNDSLGVRTKAAGPDFVVTARDGSTKNVTLGTARTIGEVLTKINDASGGKFTASLVAGSNGIRLTDNTGGGGTLSVADATGSKAATDLGLAKNGTGATLNGNDVIAGLNTVLVRNLKGGAGLTLGTINIKDRSGADQDINLSGAKTVNEILKTINDAGLDIKASLNAAGNGIQIADTSGGSGNLVIADVSGTGAAGLGIAGTFSTATPIARGANLQIKWLSETTSLSKLNGGKGVTPGSFRITNASGGQSTVNIADATGKSLGDIITAINSSATGVTASINTNGDGLLLTDTTGGAGKLKVENVTGTTARDLNLAGEATGTTLDGSYEKTVAVLATDTLQSVTDKIKTLSFGAAANVLNDGSGVSPYRLSLTAFNAGVSGRITFDAGATGLDASNLVDAQDAAVFVGGVGTAQPLLVTSSSNQITGVIPGVNLDLHGVSSQPVTLNVARNPDNVVKEIKTFVDTFNEIADGVKELTKYDTDKQEGGLLLGESTIQQVETDMYLSIQGLVQGAGRYRILADVGIKIGSGAKLEFDEDKFREALATDGEAVKNLFTQAASGLTSTARLGILNDNKGVRTVGGGTPDFKVTLRDGTNFNVTVDAAGTLNDLIQSINNGAAGKISASIKDNGKGLKIVDNTTGGSTFAITTLNGSAAALDLGISGTFSSGTNDGKDIYTDLRRQTGGGFGFQIERRLNLLVDPADGVITRENREIDDKNSQYDKRMSDIDKLVASKRARLERQFANMESVLAGLQNQQSALSGLSSTKAA
ncbi:flagellar filament capping protein FliD [Humisphaera borealis]|uniref:Filament cap protein n=1 Tax=Humisphaera borealis TaxID=2807512 RepID=A0A7M2WXR5_9BACT|nr:flagellar filament capping protein FliD [Humisphaera borealis]QOV90266.1 flagellar filament capping protein FliD [Humisphaera borealis]